MRIGFKLEEKIETQYIHNREKQKGKLMWEYLLEIDPLR